MTESDLQSLEQIANRFLKKHPGLKNLSISIFENPEVSGLKNIPENQVGGLVRGHNHLIIFADNITGGYGEFQKVLRHEAFSHFAIDCLPIKKRQELYDDVKRTIVNDKDFRKDYRDRVGERYGYDVSNDNIEEYFADIAESKIEISFSEKLIGKIRNIVRNALRSFDKSIDFNEADAKYFIHDFIKKTANGDIEPTSTRSESIQKNIQLAPSSQLIEDRVQIWRKEKESTAATSKPSHFSN